MSGKQDKLPGWCNRALQGLAYWIGHRRALYAGQPLTEGAIVAEACNLIYTCLHDNEELLCEVQYSRLIRGPLPACLGDKSRADLVIVKGAEKVKKKAPDNIQDHISVVIEVKRGPVTKKRISEDLEEDLERLAAFKQRRPNARAFLLLASEAKLPELFVSNDGTAKLGLHHPTGTSYHYRVRRVCKAAHSFRRNKFAHYACIIEVLANSGD